MPKLLSRSAAPRVLRGAWILLALAAAGCAAPAGGGDHAPTTASDQTAADRRSQTHLELASAYFSRGQNETALDEIKQAIAASPNDPEVYNLRGLVYANMGDVPLADDSFHRAIQLDPHDGDTLHNYAWFLCQQKRFDEAQVQFQAALAQPNYHGATRTQLAEGLCQARAGKWAEAEATLQKAYDFDPSNPNAAVNLTEVLYHQGQYKRAQFYISRVNAKPQEANAQTLWLAIRIEHKLNDASAMAELASRLRDRFPQSPEAAALDQGRFDD